MDLNAIWAAASAILAVTLVVNVMLVILLVWRIKAVFREMSGMDQMMRVPISTASQANFPTEHLFQRRLQHPTN